MKEEEKKSSVELSLIRNPYVKNGADIPYILMMNREEIVAVGKEEMDSLIEDYKGLMREEEKKSRIENHIENFEEKKESRTMNDFEGFIEYFFRDFNIINKEVCKVESNYSYDDLSEKMREILKERHKIFAENIESRWGENECCFYGEFMKLNYISLLCLLNSKESINNIKDPKDGEEEDYGHFR